MNMTANNSIRTASVYASVIRTKTEEIAGRYLSTFLCETVHEDEIYYSIAAALFPVWDPQEDIAIVSDITADRAYAEELYRKIADGSVLPCTLADILSDMLA